MQIRSTLFPGASFINHSVVGGRLDDLLSIYQVYLTRHLTPRWLILELHPWLLDKQIAERPWLHVSGDPRADYYSICQTLGLRPRPTSIWTPMMRYGMLVSPSYFQTSSAAMYRAIVRSRPVREDCEEVQGMDEPAVEGSVMLADGSLRFPRAVRELSAADVRKRMQMKGALNVSLTKVDIDDKAEEELDAFLELLRRQRVQVVPLFVPFHPALREIFGSSRAYASYMQAEARFRSLAQRHGLTIVGSYDPGVCGCTEADFIDARHPKESCVSRILGDWGSAIARKGPDVESSSRRVAG
jgi:hypothetical protein